MATTKRKTTGAARGRKKATATKRKRKARVGGVAASSDTLKVGGKIFKKTSCHTTKTAASAKAKSIRASGYNARVIDKCVFKGAKTKPGAVRRRG